MKKVVLKAEYWECENLDLLSPIIEQGIEYLMNDNTRVRVPYGQSFDYQEATEEEKHDFYNSLGFVFEGDIVEIVKGKLKGEFKKIKGFFRYVVPNTYGKQYTDYITFTDGTKTNILNCQICKKIAHQFNGIKVGGRI
jgi:hypothetical protein